MKRILFIATLLITQYSIAKIEHESFYFQSESDELTKNSETRLLELKNTIESKGFQLIEINAFADIEGGPEMNHELALRRSDYILKTLSADRSSVAINTYGSKRIEVEFNANDWNRVDIYFNTVEEPTKIDNSPAIKLVEHIDIEEPAELMIIDTTDPDHVREVPEEQEIVMDVPIALPIGFEGGTNEILPEEEQYLDHLYKTLKKHPSLKVLIRGHVCCENNVMRSRQRAKVVRDFLVDKGIDKKRLSIKGFGNTAPVIYPEKNEDDRAKNRRVDVVFSK